jgi:hypothetical protein
VSHQGKGKAIGTSQVWDGDKWIDRNITLGFFAHDTTHDPVALYQLNESLADTSGDTLTSLSLEAGTIRFASALPSLRGFLFDGSTSLLVDASEASLQITGNITIEMIIVVNEIATSDVTFITHYGAPSNEANNNLYSIGLRGNTGNSLTWIHEQGSSVDEVYDSNISLPLGRPTHLVAVRSSSDVTFYLNGEKFEAGSSGLNAATGGASGRFYIGGMVSAEEPFTGIISSLKIIGSALTDAEIQAEYARTLGRLGGLTN